MINMRDRWILADQPEVAICMDIGGTWIRASLVDSYGETLWRYRNQSRLNDGTEGVVARAEDGVRKAMAQAGDNAIRGIGLALAGPIDPITCVMYEPPNLPELDGVSFPARWGDRFGLPVVAGNDANLAALAEHTYGAGKGSRILVYITVSTGIGSGIIQDGDIFLGGYGLAGELGHIIVDINGPPCQCGGSGCLEAIASGTGIAKEARRRIEEGESSAIYGLASGDLDQVGAREVFAALAQGDGLAREIVAGAGRALGAGMVNIQHMLNPDLIVMGGAVSQQWDVLWPIIRSYVDEHAMKPYRETFRLVRSSLGDDVGMLGAAALVWRKVTPHSAHP